MEGLVPPKPQVRLRTLCEVAVLGPFGLRVFVAAAGRRRITPSDGVVVVGLGGSDSIDKPPALDTASPAQ